MATRYAELVQLNEQRCEILRQNRDACQAAAAILLQQFEHYLESPPNAILSVCVGPDLRLGELIGSVQTIAPELTPGPDGFWYFGLQFTFEHTDRFGHYARLGGVVGIRLNASGYVFRAHTDLPFTPDERPDVRNPNVEAVCESLFAELRRKLATPYTFEIERARFGFTPPG